MKRKWRLVTGSRIINYKTVMNLKENLGDRVRIVTNRLGQIFIYIKMNWFEKSMFNLKASNEKLYFRVE